MNDVAGIAAARSPPSTITITHIRFVNRNGVNYNTVPSSYPSPPVTPNYILAKAWCQTNDIDYCPLVISIMSFVIITSFLSIVYLCAKTSFQCPSLRCCSLLAKLRPYQSSSSLHDQHNHHTRGGTGRRARRSSPYGAAGSASSSFSLNTSTNYMNDSVSLQSINQVESLTTATTSEMVVAPSSSSAATTRTAAPSNMSARARAIWWITGGTLGKNLVTDPAHSPDPLVAPPTYDESQRHHSSMLKTKKYAFVFIKTYFIKCL